MNDKITSPITRPRFSAIARIEPLELASLAAAMSSPDEEPDTTARRAMKLFQACQSEVDRVAGELHKTEQQNSERRERFERDTEFFASLGSGEFEMMNSLRENIKVPLELFLASCMPNSKMAHRLEKWRRFLREMAEVHSVLDLKKGGVMKSELELEAAVAAEFNNDKQEGIYAREIPDARSFFNDFLGIDDREIKKAKAEKALRSKKYLPIARKVMGSEKPDKADKKILKSLTAVEQKAAIDKLDMDPAQIRNWKAAVEDAKRETSAKPKIKKSEKSEFFSGDRP